MTNSVFQKLSDSIVLVATCAIENMYKLKNLVNLNNFFLNTA